MEKINAGVVGAGGKMGARILSLMIQDDYFRIVGASEQSGSELIGKDIGSAIGINDLNIEIKEDLARAFSEADGIIDFTTPSSTIKTVEFASKNHKVLVIGTTGFTEKEKNKIVKETKNFPCVMSPNMSVGINIMFEMSQKLTELLNDDFDIEIIESHHRNKKDSPSGTALRIAELVAQTMGQKLNDIAVYSRHGLSEGRKKGEIGIQAIRGGDVVGEHSLIFYGDGERIELTHKASSRDTFAKGAIRALKWLRGKPNGLYSMKDVLGL